MTQYSAACLAEKIVKLRPYYILCGSLGLLLRGAIPKRDVHDLDFICPKAEFDKIKPTLQLYGGDERYVIENDGYKCYKVSGDGRFYYNVFVFDNDSDYEYNEVYSGMKCQTTEQMLKYKKEYNREKDRKDLQPWEPFGGVNPNFDKDGEHF